MLNRGGWGLQGKGGDEEEEEEDDEEENGQEEEEGKNCPCLPSFLLLFFFLSSKMDSSAWHQSAARKGEEEEEESAKRRFRCSRCWRGGMSLSEENSGESEGRRKLSETEILHLDQQNWLVFLMVHGSRSCLTVVQKRTARTK